jgi:hypothetical protein|nr:hypothetical protein [Candidatus Krumholzibacteria bacterium]
MRFLLGFRAHIFAGLFMVAGLPVFATLCVQLPSVEWERQESDLVFSGLVKSHRNLEPGEIDNGSQGVTVWIFEVGQIWKGELRSEVRIMTHPDRHNTWFRDGEQFVVFAKHHYSNPGIFWVNTCSRTRETQYAMEERFQLGTPLVVNPNLELPEISQCEVDTFSLLGTRYRIEARPDPRKGQEE